MTKGIERPSKLLLYGYVEEVEELREKGMSFQKIAEVINSRHPENPTISKDVVNRFYLGKTKKLEATKPIEIIEYFKDMFEDIYNELRKSSLSSKERSALIQFI